MYGRAPADRQSCVLFVVLALLRDADQHTWEKLIGY